MLVGSLKASLGLIHKHAVSQFMEVGWQVYRNTFGNHSLAFGYNLNERGNNCSQQIIKHHPPRTLQPPTPRHPHRQQNPEILPIIAQTHH